MSSTEDALTQARSTVKIENNKNDNQANIAMLRGNKRSVFFFDKVFELFDFLTFYVHFTVTILKLNCFQCFSLHFHHFNFYFFLLLSLYSSSSYYYYYKMHCQKAPKSTHLFTLKIYSFFLKKNKHCNWN